MKGFIHFVSFPEEISLASFTGLSGRSGNFFLGGLFDSSRGVGGLFPLRSAFFHCVSGLDHRQVSQRALEITVAPTPRRWSRRSSEFLFFEVEEHVF
jgi:hypothetical protein